MAPAHQDCLPQQLLSQMLEKQHEGVETTSNGRLDEPLPSFDLPRSNSPLKPRPWSALGIKSTLSPSPTLIENAAASKDDSSISPIPVTPRRPNVPQRGLSLQMPPQDLSSTSTAHLSKRIPLSPKPDCSTAYPSPASVLPRRSRGLDFSRAATNLHHSILAEQSSPESSPTVGGRRGVNFPGRKGCFTPPDGQNIPESPRNTPSSLWSTITNGERGGLSSSVGSSAIIDNDSSSSSSEDMMDLGEDDDTIHVTPHGGLNLVNPFGPIASTLGGDSTSAFNPAAAKLISYQRARLQSRRDRTRGSSSSASGQSNVQSPVPPSPPLLRNIESSLSMSGLPFLDESTRREINSRRESLSLGTSDMQLSDADHSGDEGQSRLAAHEDVPIATPVTPSMEDRKQVVRRAVTRRSNLLVGHLLLSLGILLTKSTAEVEGICTH